MTLDPGYYKLKRGTTMFSSYHFLRVFIKDGNKYFQLDHGIEELVHKNTARDLHDHGYQIEKKYTRLSPPQYNKVRARIEFEDEEGCKYELVASNGFVLDHIFRLFPRLKKHFWS